MRHPGRRCQVVGLAGGAGRHGDHADGRDRQAGAPAGAGIGRSSLSCRSVRRDRRPTASTARHSPHSRQPSSRTSCHCKSSTSAMTPRTWASATVAASCSAAACERRCCGSFSTAPPWRCVCRSACCGRPSLRRPRCHGCGASARIRRRSRPAGPSCEHPGHLVLARGTAADIDALGLEADEARQRQAAVSLPSRASRPAARAAWCRRRLELGCGRRGGGRRRC